MDQEEFVRRVRGTRREPVRPEVIDEPAARSNAGIGREASTGYREMMIFVVAVAMLGASLKFYADSRNDPLPTKTSAAQSAQAAAIPPIEYANADGEVEFHPASPKVHGRRIRHKTSGARTESGASTRGAESVD